MARTYRNTLKAHAYALSCLGGALTDLAHEHRVAASAMERQPSQGPRGDSDFADWIATAAEVSAAAERLLELEVELARHHGMTWEQVADALGVSRQSAWERFRTHSRWDRTHRLSRLRRVRRAAMFRRMALGQSEEFVAAVRQMMRDGHASSERRPPYADR
ncbi:hypothetical protein [Micromonospora sp. WMMD736]|uniref:hypothetical protein n=1 Tax=Micromonospora sp. WMMD736 TaxID=3404112 RepID=UPI003B9262CC